MNFGINFLWKRSETNKQTNKKQSWIKETQRHNTRVLVTSRIPWISAKFAVIIFTKTISWWTLCFTSTLPRLDFTKIILRIHNIMLKRIWQSIICKDASRQNIWCQADNVKTKSNIVYIHHYPISSKRMFYIKSTKNVQNSSRM